MDVYNYADVTVYIAFFSSLRADMTSTGSFFPVALRTSGSYTTTISILMS